MIFQRYPHGLYRLPTEFIRRIELVHGFSSLFAVVELAGVLGRGRAAEGALGAGRTSPHIASRCGGPIVARPVTLGRVTLAPRVPAAGAPGSISGSRQKPPLHAPTGVGRGRALQ